MGEKNLNIKIKADTESAYYSPASKKSSHSFEIGSSSLLSVFSINANNITRNIIHRSAIDTPP